MKRKNVFLKYSAILLLCMLGGCLIGYTLVSANNNPDRTRWEQMPAPPEPAIKIIELGGYGKQPHSITIEAASGKQYDCCGSWPSTWNALEYNKSRYGWECNKPESTLYNQLSGTIIDCANVTQFEWVTEHYYAALLDDETLWRWHYYYGLDTILNAIGLGILAGLVIGVGGIVLFRNRNRAKQKT